MDFTSSFETGRKESNNTKKETEQESEDRAKEALRNKSFHEFVNYMKTTLAAGVMAAGVHGTSLQAETHSNSTSTETKTAVSKEKTEPSSVDSNREIAEDYVEKNMSESLGSDAKQEVIRQVTTILNHYGEGPINNIHRAEKHHDEKEERHAGQVEVKGFKKLSMSSEKLKNIWSEQFYPGGLIEGEIESVEYTDSTYAEADEDGSYRQADFKRMKENLRFFRPQKFDESFLPTDRVWAFDIIFAHELSHAADWVANDDLSHSERIEFFHDVHQTAQKDFVQNLVAIDNADDFDSLSPEKRLRVAQEGWANIGELYFSKPSELKEKHPSLYDLADKWLTREDQNFDPTEAQRQRQKLYSDVVKKEDNSTLARQ